MIFFYVTREVSINMELQMLQEQFALTALPKKSKKYSHEF